MVAVHLAPRDSHNLLRSTERIFGVFGKMSPKGVTSLASKYWSLWNVLPPKYLLSMMHRIAYPSIVYPSLYDSSHRISFFTAIVPNGISSTATPLECSTTVLCWLWYVSGHKTGSSAESLSCSLRNGPSLTGPFCLSADFWPLPPMVMIPSLLRSCVVLVMKRPKRTYKSGCIVGRQAQRSPTDGSITVQIQGVEISSVHVSQYGTDR